VTDPVAAAEAALVADETHADPAIWITRVPARDVLARARTLADEGPRGRPLWGVPFAVKDNIDVAGLPTTAGCPGFAYVPTESAPCVARLLDAGAVLIGKTNMDQFATGLAGVRSPYGTPRNPFDPARVPGGSSSGSAMAVAAGIVPLALGTDTAGSGRVPAAFGNIVGLKPTIGSVSGRGVVPACRSIETVSVFAASVDQALVAARLIVGYDDADPFCRLAPWPHLRRGSLPAAARIAAIEPGDNCAPEVRDCYWRAAELLHAETVEIEDMLAVGRLMYQGPWVAERTAALQSFLRHHAETVHPITHAILLDGETRRTVDAFDGFHEVAAARRRAVRLFRDFDALLLPTAPFCPTIEALAADPIGANSQLGTFTNFVNLCDLAAIAVPAGIGGDGLPVGVMLIGPAWSEGRLAAIADSVHRAPTTTIGSTRSALPPPTEPDQLQPTETALFCVGAHMSGLPLNHELRQAGGRFLRRARSARAYRLYVLGNRPGLVRGGIGAIEGEVWALPSSAIGRLLATISAPLGLGTVMLTDGPCLGFLAEAAGVVGTLEITQHGSWRAWLNAHGGHGDG